MQIGQLWVMGVDKDYFDLPTTINVCTKPKLYFPLDRILYT